MYALINSAPNFNTYLNITEEVVGEIIFWKDNIINSTALRFDLRTAYQLKSFIRMLQTQDAQEVSVWQERFSIKIGPKQKV